MIANERTDALSSYITDGFRQLVRAALHRSSNVEVIDREGASHQQPRKIESVPASVTPVRMATRSDPNIRSGSSVSAATHKTAAEMGAGLVPQPPQLVHVTHRDLTGRSFGLQSEPEPRHLRQIRIEEGAAGPQEGHWTGGAAVEGDSTALRLGADCV